jgi:glycosyltransferase involved in cell wall biosynthesis
MKIHFVYSIPEKKIHNFFERLTRKIRHLLNKYGVPIGLVSNRQPTSEDLSKWPIQSPFENTKNIYKALSQLAPTYLYHLTERVHCNFEKDDIFLGHPFFPHSKDGLGVTEFALQGQTRPKKLALISPLHCDITIVTNHINKDFLDDINDLMPSADVLFAIMGQYWWDQWGKSPYSHWMSKMVRLDMAVDSTRYPRVKKVFNPPGKRGYLYIGNSSDPRKGTDFLSRLMAHVDTFPKGWIGSGPEIPNIPRISNGRALSPDFMSSIAQDYDFFISPSRADPNPTTILESMAWGFPVICTPQSGYLKTNYLHNIPLDDVIESARVLNYLQYLDDSELNKMADEGRKAVENDYNWSKFTEEIIKHLKI